MKEVKTTPIRLSNKLVLLCDQIVKTQPIYQSTRKLIETAVVKMLIENNMVQVREIVKNGL